MLFHGKLDGIGRLGYELIKRLAKMRPNDRITCIYDRRHEKYYDFGDNVEHVHIGPPARHPILWKIWFDYRLPRFLKKLKADVFISIDGYNSLRSDIPSIIFGHDLAPLHFPDHMKLSHSLYYRRYHPLFMKKANAIIANSHFTKQDIIETLGIDESKIKVAHSGLSNHFKILDDQEIQQTKDQFTDGEDYFVFVGTRSPRKNLVRLIQAFHKYRWELGLNHLVIVGRPGWKDREFLNEHKKDPRDIHLFENASDELVARLIGAADAVIFPSLYEGFGLPIIEAQAAGVPVITSNVSSMPEVAGDAALLANPISIDSITHQMQLTIDDEIRYDLIKKGFENIKRFNWDDQAMAVDQTITNLLLQNDI